MAAAVSSRVWSSTHTRPGCALDCAREAVLTASPATIPSPVTPTLTAAAPQAGQAAPRGVPHDGQNRADAGSGSLQDWHWGTAPPRFGTVTADSVVRRPFRTIGRTGTDLCMPNFRNTFRRAIFDAIF